MLPWSIIAVELINSSDTQNHKVFQPTSEQVEYGAARLESWKEIERLLQFSFEVNN